MSKPFNLKQALQDLGADIQDVETHFNADSTDMSFKLPNWRKWWRLDVERVHNSPERYRYLVLYYSPGGTLSHEQEKLALMYDTQEGKLGTHPDRMASSHVFLAQWHDTPQEVLLDVREWNGRGTAADIAVQKLMAHTM